MRGARPTSIIGAAVVALLATSPPFSALPVPVGPSEGVPLQHVGVHALESRLRFGALYAETPEGTRFFARDQMMGVLAALAARTLRPDQADAWTARAVELWEGAEAAFLSGGFYARTLPSPSDTVCIDAEANTWALRAAHALGEAGVDASPDPAARAVEVRSLLSDFLTGGTSRGRPPCPAEAQAVPVHQRPLLLLALIESRADGGPSTDSAVRSHLSAFLREATDGAFALPDGLYTATLNAQMLVVLAEAAEVFGDPEFASARDAVGAWLQDVAVRTQDGRLVASNMGRGPSGFEPTIEQPDGQIWAAYALANLRRANASLVRDEVVRGLAATYLESYWTGGPGGFAGPGSFVYFDYNVLPALLTSAPGLQVTGLDSSTVGFVVPAKAEFTYPAPTDPAANKLYLANQWSARFTLAGAEAGVVDALVPARDLGGFWFFDPPSAFHPAPHVARTTAAGRTEVPLLRAGSDPQLLWFQPTLAPGPNTFRLDAHAPVDPVTSAFSSEIVVGLQNLGPQAVTVGALQLELDATQILIRSVQVNDVLFPSFEVVDGVFTEVLPQPHMRITLRDVPFPPGGGARVVLSYSDVVRPTVEPIALSRDLLGADPIRSGDPVDVFLGEPVYARATVRDNGVLRSVQLRFRVEDRNLDLRMTEVPGQGGVYAVRLPTEGPTGRAVLQVVAVDAAGTGNLNESAPFEFELKDPLLSGSIVLFVFSGVLFVASMIIWIKVRRKAPR